LGNSEFSSSPFLDLTYRVLYEGDFGNPSFSGRFLNGSTAMNDLPSVLEPVLLVIALCCYRR